MIAIVNYNMGNLRSVEKAVLRAGSECVITNNKDEILKADKIILPGVGHFKRGMSELNSLGLISVLNECVLVNKKPVLGICLGLQLMTKHSEEGNQEGLGWFDANTIQFEKHIDYRVPHIGWNTIASNSKAQLLEGIKTDDEFYFVHSFYVKSSDENIVTARTEYGIRFDSILEKENIVGCQFHPEKSHDEGSRIIKNFIEQYV